MKRSVFFLITKLCILQTYFHFCAKFGPQGYQFEFLLLAIFILFGNYFLVKNSINLRRYLVLAAVFVAYGVFQDYLLELLGIIEFQSPHPQFWVFGLWLVFLCYYGDLFGKLATLRMSLMVVFGAIGGLLAYWRGFDLSGVVIHNQAAMIICLLVSWAVFMPLSLLAFSKSRP